MSACTFFGHRMCPEDIKPLISDAVRKLIIEQDVDAFYVGNQGQFDSYVRKVLSELSREFPHIQYSVVFAYLPKPGDSCSQEETLFPEGIETVPPRFAIFWRNHWMLDRADYVITYITNPCGGAAQFAEKAKKKGKTVVNLSEKVSAC